MKNILLILILLSAVILTGCMSQSIADVKTSDNVGKTVKVTGTVENTMKLGSLSGYTLKDDTGTISVSSESLPKEGDTITVKGTLIKDANDFSMYLLAEACVATVTGDAFGNPDCIRFSYATSEDILKEALKRIKEAVSFTEVPA